jgi:phosphoesterase RecJ-like protein
MPTTLPDLLAVPAHRAASIERYASEFTAGHTVALLTHINSDGDGCGSEVALALLLAQRGMKVRIVNPTPWPEMFDFLLDGVEERSADGAAALVGVELLMVLDISDLKRLGSLGAAVRNSPARRLVIDHHVPQDEPAGEIVVSDASACATGELIFDFARVLDLEISAPIARAIYIAILSDTGGFRFSNTSPRCHAIA